MAWRVIIRFSMNNDVGSRVRNAVAPALATAGIANTATGTWEGVGLTPRDVARQVSVALDAFANAGPPPVELDHLWVYIDKDCVQAQ